MHRGYRARVGLWQIQSGLSITMHSFNIYWKIALYQCLCQINHQRATRPSPEMERADNLV